MRSLRSINLNLMPVLRELLRKRNVTHAAQALNMSQPAVSEALSRLRHIFQDEILTADGRQLRLTSRAERIQQILESSLGQIETLVCEAPLDLTTLEGVIKIATADYVIQAFGLKLIRRVAERAPRLTIQFLDINPRSQAEMSHGSIDFILTPAPGAAGAFEHMTLFEDRVVCVVPKHSRYGATLSEEEFWSARHAAFAPGDGVLHSIHSTILRAMGRQEFNAVIVQNFMLLPMIVEAANAIAVVPSWLAETPFVQASARVAELPFSFPHLRVGAIWHASKSNDPTHRWLREQMKELAADGPIGLQPRPLKRLASV